MKSISILFILFLPVFIYAQLHDNTWLFGYSNNQDTTDKYGILLLTFTQGEIQIQQNTKIDFNFSESNASFSDSLGNSLSYSNAIHIGNKNWTTMDGGAYLMEGEELIGGIWPQFVVCIPFPDEANKHVYIYQSEEYITGTGFCSPNLLYGVVDRLLDKGRGKLIQKDIFVLEDTLSLGNLSAVKHANGRDWWMVVNEINTNRFYRVLFSPNGAQVMGSQEVGTNIKHGVGQVVFSPDGTHFANYYGISAQQGGYLEVYDFDRCTGLLSNHRSAHITNGSWGGIAFSPNSRFLYLNNTFEAYQYDFEAPDVLASKIKIADWDGYQSPFPAAFYLMQLAPDGQIYSATPTGCDVLHVIHRPDEPGTSCQYEQHAVHLPTYNSLSMPNFPNYRLGPIDGSPCDTLGLNNIPVSWWRYERDTLDALFFAFRDISWYEPTSWVWDFGDGSGSTERYPEHQFQTAGTYEVCLTVSNVNGTDTRCKTIFAGVSATADLALQEEISVTPNPFTSRLLVSLSAPMDTPVFRLFDMYGKSVGVMPLYVGVNTLAAAHLERGMYFWQVESRGRRVKSGKVGKVN